MLFLMNQSSNVLHLPCQDNLPNDIESLKTIILEQQDLLENQNTLIEKLQHELSVLKRHIFGQRSEKRPKQDGEEEEEDDEKDDNKKETITYTRNKRKQHKHHQIPDDLPVERVEYGFPDNQCPCGCGNTLKIIGESITKTLEYIPASLFVRHHARLKYTGCLNKEGVLIASMPSLPIEKSIAGPSLIANMMVEKYDDHLPIYRQQERLKRHGIDLPLSTMLGILHKGAQVLQPLAEALKKDILTAEVINSDDTTIPVLSPGNKKTKTGRLWIYLSCAPSQPKIAIYKYTIDRSGKWPQDFLKNYTGYLQADAYSGYDALFKREKNPIVEVGCWAHVRRKFYDIAKNIKDKKSVPHRILELISALYDIEREAKDMSVQDRYALRQEQSLNVLKKIKTLLEDSKKHALPKSPLTAAINYALNQWEALIVYTTNGKLSIDNNAGEQKMRDPVIGRKNWLFAGSDESGEHTATLYSLIETAKMNGINPFTYLCDILTRISDYPAKRISDLLPYHWKPPTEDLS